MYAVLASASSPKANDFLMVYEVAIASLTRPKGSVNNILRWIRLHFWCSFSLGAVVRGYESVPPPKSWLQSHFQKSELARRQPGFLHCFISQKPYERVPTE